METPPCQEWFQKSRDQWFIRVQVTGLRPWRLGPFPTKHKGLLFLDHMLTEVMDAISSVSSDLGRYQYPTRRFELRSGHYPIIEDELCGR